MIAVTIAGVLSGAIATALSAFVQRQTTAVVFRGLGIEIARGDIGTTEFWNGEIEVDGVLVVAAKEDLDMEVPAQFSIRGELGNLNALFWTGDAIGIIAQNEPHASDQVIELKAGSIPIILWLEHRKPRIGRGFCRLDCPFVVFRGRGSINADGDVAVEFVGRVEVPHIRQDARRGIGAQGRGLEEAACGLQGRGRGTVSVDGGDLIRRVGGGHEQSVSAEPSQIGIGEDADVAGHRVHFDLEISGVEGGACDAVEDGQEWLFHGRLPYGDIHGEHGQQ